MSATGTSGRRHRPRRPRSQAGRLAGLRPGHPRRPPRHGQDRARHQHRLQHRARLSRPKPPRRNDGDRRRRHRRLLLAGNVVRAAGDPHHRRAVRRALLQDPPRRHHQHEFHQVTQAMARDAVDPVLYRPDRRHFDRPAHRARAATEAPARARPPGRRLPAAAVRHERARTTACRK